jgi:hypothetical protein
LWQAVQVVGPLPLLLWQLMQSLCATSLPKPSILPGFVAWQSLQFLSNSWCILWGNVTVPILAGNVITSAAIAKEAVKKTRAKAEIIFFNLLTSFIWKMPNLFLL